MSRASTRKRPVGGGGISRLDRARGPVLDDDARTALYRHLDFHPTPLWAARAVAELVLSLDPGRWWVWEPACGQGHFAHALGPYFARVFATDVHDYGWDGQHGPPLDFLSPAAEGFEADWIVTNAPNKHAEAFLDAALRRARRGVAFLTRLTWLDSIGRFETFFGEQLPLTALGVFAERVPQHLGGWDPADSWATPTAVFVWLKPEALASSPAPRLAMGGRGAFVGVGIPPGTKARLTRDEDVRLFGREALSD